MKVSLKLILTLTTLYFLILFISCKKIDSTQEDKPSNSNEITNKFFNANRTSDPKEAALVNYLKNRNNKENFVEGIVSRIGYPRWDKAFQFPNKTKSNATTNLVGDSTSIYHIPFVRDSQNFVNASMILIANQTDTSISYKCDWQYSQKQNSTQSYSDSAEYFAIYFMILDKTVFGYNKFTITDSNLFRSTNHHTKHVTLNSFTTNTTNNLLSWVTTCQDVTISWNDCPYAVCTGANGSCDGCPQCTSSVSYTYCSSGWQETGGGGGGGTGGGGTGGGGTGGGTGGGGSGGSGGGSTPPICNNVPSQSARGNVPSNNLVEGCSPGWNPAPPVYTPSTITQKKDYLIQQLGITHAQQINLFINISDSEINALFSYIYTDNTTIKRDYVLWALNFFSQNPSEDFSNIFYSNLTEVENDLVSNPCLKSVTNTITKAKLQTLVYDLFKKEQATAAAAKPKFKIKFKFEEVTSLPDNKPATTQDIYAQNSPTTLSEAIMIVKLNTTVLAGKSKEWITSVILHEICHSIRKAAAVNATFPLFPFVITQEQEHTEMILKKHPLDIYNNLMQIFPNATNATPTEIAVKNSDFKDLAIGGFSDVLFSSNGTLLSNTLTTAITGAGYFPSINISNAYDNTIPDYKNLTNGKGTICN
jgi:hypothetical protein